MRSILARGFLTSICLAWLCPVALAWNKLGHQVSGAIAYQVLQKESPATAARVAALLRKMPDFEKSWRKKVEGVPPGEQDELLFMLAARWPDDIRRNPNYDHPKWHYINFAFVPDGQPESVRALPPDSDNILEGFQLNLRVAQGQSAESDKAVALCWIFHLVGDIHQPLHATALFTTDYPQGDKGGNLVYVRVKEGGRALNLHFLWDGLLLGSENTREARNLASKLLSRPEFARDRLSELKEPAFEKWAKSESFPLAKEIVYQGGKMQGNPDPESAPILPEGYTTRAKEVAERRIVLAGYRIADLLRQTLDAKGRP
jgi:S1/P1 Nuclease